MNIVQGRGRNRRVVELPHGSVWAGAAKADPAEYARHLSVIADMTLGSDKLVSLSVERFKKITARTLRLPHTEART
jgi:hypothetical protein